MNPYLKTLIQNRFRVLNLVWVAMMTSTLIFGFLVFRQPAAEGAPSPAQLASEPFVQVLAIAALLSLVASRFLGKVFLGRPQIEAARKRPWTADSLAAETSDGKPIYRPEDIAKMLEFTERERNHLLAFGPYFTSKIVSFALSEAPSIMGFLVANQVHQPQAFIPFAALAYVGFFLARPSETELAEIAN